jgi:hypothetical protein
MPSLSHSFGFYHPHNIGWGVQIMKLLIIKSCISSNMQFVHNVVKSPENIHYFGRSFSASLKNL